MIFRSISIYISCLVLSLVMGCNNSFKETEEHHKNGKISSRYIQSLNHLLKKVNQGEITGVIPTAKRLLEEFERTRDSLHLSQAYELIARSHYYYQDIDSAIIYWRKGLQFMPNRNYEMEAIFLTNLGSAYMFQGYQRTAISYFLEARTIYLKHKIKTNNYWVNYLNIGVCYMELKDFALAARYFKKIPFEGDPNLDVIVPINLAKLYGLQDNEEKFQAYINIALKNQSNAPFYSPILKDVHLEFVEKLSSRLDLQQTFNLYKNEYKQINLAFDLSLWKASIKLGMPLGEFNDLYKLKLSIDRSDYFLLISYYQVLTDWYEWKKDYKSAYISKSALDQTEKILEQKNAKDKLYDYTILAKRNELQNELKDQRQRNKIQETQLTNRSYFLYFFIAIFCLLVISSVSLFIGQRRKFTLNKKNFKIQELELALAKEEKVKLQATLNYNEDKLNTILETVSKIAILKKQLDAFFNTIETTPDMSLNIKQMIKEAKLDFNLFFNNYQDLAVISNLIGIEKSKLDSIRTTYPSLNDNEFRVILLIMQNYTSKEMAMLLSCTEKNIEYFRSQIRKKLNVSKEVNIRDFLSESPNK